MDNKKFQRRVEDFVCEHCGNEVRGSGYTNHCPKCLWSKHVDINPGDRMEKCQGEMEPARVEGASPEYSIVHRCCKCGVLRRNKTKAEDNEQALLAIAKEG